jgi:hypothetical protein
VLISIDAEKSDLSSWHVRPDKDYGLVWVKSYDEGRVFNCALGHTPTLFETPALAQMMLNAIQFVLGGYPLDSLNPYRLWFAFGLPEVRVNYLVMGNRIHGHSLLRQAKEKLASTL